MTDIREICSGCSKEFSPLSSARGIDADYCLDCKLSSKETKTSIKGFPQWPMNYRTNMDEVK